ncbi:MAG: hypothetical protein V7K21_23800 [Nostoc sp.]|uniref:hypothetical protein n=1 Tax=Nostoc sp. TaxID=1180 RepID=UPI002FF87698
MSTTTFIACVAVACNYNSRHNQLCQTIKMSKTLSPFEAIALLLPLIADDEYGSILGSAIACR